jgi:raffinose/stachyose/melibiose transport system substrate-binding protein
LEVIVGNVKGQRLLPRREFLKLGGTGLAALGLGSVLASCGGGGGSGGQELEMWWWGEQEAPGLKDWLNESIGQYEKKSGNTIKTTLQDTTDVVAGFQRAAAAQNAPDIAFLWNGIYHMESVWQGYLEPLNGLIPEDLLKSSNATALSIFEGKQYRLGWYAVPLLWVYNKQMFDRVGLDADAPPQTWDDFLAACDKLKGEGITPITGGLKDGPWGEWWMGQALSQNLESPADAISLFIGDLNWNEPQYYEQWSRLEEVWKADYINKDINSIDLYPGIDLFGAGKGAMTLIAGPLVPDMQSKLGAENVGVMVFPVWGQGAMAGRPIRDTQGLGISSQSDYKEEAADFLQFLHSEERVNALWDQVSQLPADTTWDGSVIDDPTIKQIWQEWMHGDSIPYISNLMPVLFWTDAMFVNSQKIIAGEYTGEEAGANAEEVSRKWREQNPDFVDNYETWRKDLKL